ncbi:MAG: marine proteobacterial sortase target protein [Gammaproteobacteria bacterium]|nr:marine proteobacterial sortase target protein [Gammaproteobacteria bacterium]
MKKIILSVFFVLLIPNALLASSNSNDDYALLSYHSKDSDRSYEQMPLSTDVKVSINGVVARTQITQTFSNQTNEWLEGIYQFPLPENAAVDSLKMIIGEQIIEGEIQEKKQAEKTYQEAKKSGKRASLVKQVRPNLFTTKLANIGPDEQIKIQIEFQQLIHIDGTEFSYTLPLGITPRYQPDRKVIEQTFNPAAESEPLSSVVTQFNQTSIPDRPVNFNIELKAGFDLAKIDSPHHAIKVQPQGIKQLITIDKSTQAERDFILKWQPQLGQQPKASLLSETLGEDTYHLLVILPPTHDLIQQQVKPKEVIFVVDSSGSMSGESMQQAKAGLRFALQQLNADDSFNIIDFDSGARQLFPQAKSLDESSLEEAELFIQNMKAEGGTNIASAVHIALDKPDSSKLRQIVFLTDGSIGNEQEIFAMIRSKLSNNRLFTIGIGSAPNSYFMRKAAEEGRGTFTYINKTEQVQTELSKLFKKLRYPVLSNLGIDTNGVSKSTLAKMDLQPKYLRDLYLGEPLYATYKQPKQAPDNKSDALHLKGFADGYEWDFKLPYVTHGKDTGIAKLWARMKIDSLKNDMSQDYLNSEQYKQQITDTALNFHLVSDYTSLVAVDKTPVNVSEKIKQLQLANRIAAGWTPPQAKTHGYPRGGTDSLLMLVIGLISLLLSGLIWFRRS